MNVKQHSGASSRERLTDWQRMAHYTKKYSQAPGTAGGLAVEPACIAGNLRTYKRLFFHLAGIRCFDQITIRIVEIDNHLFRCLSREDPINGSIHVVC